MLSNDVDFTELDSASNHFIGSLGRSSEYIEISPPRQNNESSSAFSKVLPDFHETNVELGFSPASTAPSSPVTEPIRKRPRLNGPMPDFYEQALTLSTSRRNNRIDHLSLITSKEFETSIGSIESLVIPVRFGTDNLALAQLYVSESSALDLGKPTQLHAVIVKRILNPEEGDELYGKTVAHRLEICMRYINTTARVYSQGTCSRVIYKLIDPETGIVKAKIDTKEVFFTTHARSLSKVYIATIKAEETPVTMFNQMELFHYKPTDRQTSRSIIWRRITSRAQTTLEQTSGARGTGIANIDGWDCNILKLWIQGNWFSVVKSITFSPIPTGSAGSATFDQLNLWHGVQHDKEDCFEAYNEKVVYYYDDPQFNQYMHGYLQNTHKLVDGQECHLWRHVGDLIEFHGLTQIANGDAKANEWIKWHAAHILRRPYERTGRSLCCKGREGVGKTMYFECLKRLLGPEYVFTTSSAEDVLGDFNDSIVGKILIIFEEASTDAEATKKLSGHWKRAITDDMIRLRRMYSPAEEHRNFMNFLSISQHEDQVPWTFRRLAAFETSDNVNSSEYYDALAAIAYNNLHPRQASKATRAWAYHQLYIGFSDVQLEKMKRELVPQTPLYRRLLIKNLPQVDQWLYQQLRDGTSAKPSEGIEDNSTFLVRLSVSSHEEYLKLIIKTCNEDGIVIYNNDRKLSSDFYSDFICGSGVFKGAKDEWSDEMVPLPLQKVTPWVHFGVTEGEIDYKVYDFFNHQPYLKVVKTWEDVAYWYNFRVRWDLQAKNWNRWVSIEDWYYVFKQSMTATRHTVTGKTGFISVVKCMLGAREPLLCYNNPIKVSNMNLGGILKYTTQIKVYWELPELLQARKNWASKHYTDITVFNV